MGYLLEIARKIQTQERGSISLYYEINEFNEVTSSSVVNNRPFTEKRAHTPKANPTPTAERQPPIKVKAVWPPEVQSLVDWFMIQEAPVQPFLLEPHLRVVGPGKFFESLRREIETGPRGPRARLGTLQSDLRKLKAYLN
jgi:hypothetical protein